MSRTVTVRIVGDERSLAGAFNRAGVAGASFGTKVGASLKKLAVIGTAAAIALAGLSGKAAIDFESSFAGVRKTVDATEGEFKALAKGFRGLAKEIPVNVNELNRIGEAAGQLGIKKKAILGFTRTIADLSVATNLTSEQASNDLARLANITQMPQSQFRRLGSTVVQLGNTLAGTESEIVAFGLRIAGAGRQVGLAEHEILAIGGALSSVGIEAEAGGTAISTTMVKIAASVRKGGTDLTGFARVAGVSAGEFKQRWETDAAQALVLFVEGLARTKREGGDVFGTLDKLGLGGIRVRDALLRASGAGDLLRDALKTGSQAWRENTALTKEAAERYKTTASRLQLLRNRLTDIGISVGEKMLPALNAGLAGVTRVLERMDQAKGLKAKVRIVLEGVGSLAGDIARTGTALGLRLAAAIQAELRLVDWSQVGRSIVTGISSALTTVSELATKLGDLVQAAMRTIDWPQVGRVMGPGLAAAMATAFAVLLDPGFWVRNWDLALAVGLAFFPLGRLASGLGRLLAPLGRMLAPALGGALGTALRVGGDAILGVAGRLGATLGRVFLTGAIRALDGLRALPGLVARQLARIPGAAAGALGSFSRFVVKALALNAIINAVAAAVSGAAARIRAAVGSWVAAATQLGQRAVDAVRRALAKLGEIIIGALRAGVGAVRGMAGAFFSAAFSIGANIANGIVAGVAGLAGRLAGAVGSAVSGALGKARGMLDIRSPSRVTEREIGGPLGEGVIVGLRRALADLTGELERTIEQPVRAFGRRFRNATAAINFVETRREIEDLRRAVVDAERDLAKARKEGKRDEILEAERRLARAREDITIRSLRRQADAEERALERRREKIEAFRDAFRRLADQILRAFDKETAGHKTASELDLERIRERRELEDLNRAVADAERDLAEARAEGDPQRIAEAEHRLARAREDITIRSLEDQAAAERDAYAEERERLRDALDQRLTALENHFAKEGAAWEAFFNGILALAQEFGVQLAGLTGTGTGVNWKHIAQTILIPAAKKHFNPPPTSAGATHASGLASPAAAAAAPVQFHFHGPVYTSERELVDKIVEPVRRKLRERNERAGHIFE